MLLSISAQDGMVEGLEEVLLANPDDLFTHRAYAVILAEMMAVGKPEMGAGIRSP